MDPQAAYLRAMYARRYASIPPCDCPGCKFVMPSGKLCKGFVKGCKCDESIEALREARKRGPA